MASPRLQIGETTPSRSWSRAALGFLVVIAWSTAWASQSAEARPGSRHGGDLGAEGNPAGPTSSAMRFQVRFEGFAERPVEVILELVPVASDAAPFDGITKPDRAASSDSEEQGRLVSEYRLPLDAEGVARLEVEPRAGGASQGRHWLASCSSREQWCQPFLVDLESGDEATPLRVYRAGWLEGTFRPAEALPEFVRIQGWAAEPEGDELAFELAPVIEEAAFRVKVPATNLDLRWAPAGWAPVYRWDIEARAGETLDLGALSLREGASVCAFVMDEETGLPASDAQVELGIPEPEAGTPARELARLQRFRWQTKTNARGFFQVAGLAEGELLLAVTRGRSLAGGSERPVSVSRRVSVSADAETCLEDLLLPAHRVARVSIQPALHPDGEPWRLVFVAKQSRDAASVRIRTELDGSASPALAQGLYELKIAGDDGRQVARRAVEIDGEAEIEIELELVRLEGEAFFGDEPLLAQVRLVGNGVDTSFESDFAGRFGGWIEAPGSGAWMARVRSVAPELERWLDLGALEAEEGRLELRLQLGGGVVLGTVVDELGRPLRHARVTASGESGTAVSTRSGVDGGFRLEALDPGEHRVWARSEGRASSGVHRLELPDGGEISEVELTVGPGAQRAFRVLGAGDSAIPGARVTVTFPGHPAWVRTRTAGADGRFELRTPERVERAVFTVAAHSAGMLWSACVELEREGETVLLLPSSPTGTLVLRAPESAEEASPVSQVILLTEGGGILGARHWSAWSGWSASRGLAQAGEEGSWKIEGLAPGWYEARRIEGSGGEFGCRPFDARSPGGYLPPGGELTLPLP